jgi:hypothetical protein
MQESAKYTKQFALSIEVSGYYPPPWVSPPSPALTLVLAFIDDLLSRGSGNMIKGKSAKHRQQFVLSVEVSGYYAGPWVSPPSPALTLVLTFIDDLLSRGVGM